MLRIPSCHQTFILSLHNCMAPSACGAYNTSSGGMDPACGRTARAFHCSPHDTRELRLLHCVFLPVSKGRNHSGMGQKCVSALTTTQQVTAKLQNVTASQGNPSVLALSSCFSTAVKTWHSLSVAAHSRMGEAKTEELERSSLRQSQGCHEASDSGKWNRTDMQILSGDKLSMFLITSSLLRRIRIPHTSLVHPNWRNVFCTS